MKAVFKTVTGALTAVVLLGALVAPGVAHAQQASANIEVFRVRPNFYLLSGAGANIGVQVGPDGVVLVDSGTKDASAACWRKSAS